MEFNNSVEIVLKKKLNGEEIIVEVYPEDTVADLKERALHQLGEPLDFSEFKIEGKHFDDDTNIIEYFTSGLSVTGDDIGTDEPELPPGACVVSSDEPDIKLNIATAGELFCAAVNCSSNKFDTPDIPLFKFPPQKKRCREWLQAAGRTDLLSQQFSEIYNQIALCSKHFTKDCFINKDKKNLKYDAVPVLFNDMDDSEEMLNDVIIKKQLVNDEPTVENSVIEVGKRSNKIVVSNINDIQTVLLKKLEEADGENVFITDGQEDDDAIEDEAVEEEDEEEDCIEPEHPGTLCRLCANPLPLDVNNLFIFGEEGEMKDIFEKINSCLPISVKKTDPLPKQICLKCSAKLEYTHLFAETCIMAELKLKTLTRKYLVHKLKKQSAAVNAVTNIYCCPLCPRGTMQVRGNETEAKDQNIVCVKKELEDEQVPTGLFGVSKFEPEDASHDLLINTVSDHEDLFSDDDDEDPLTSESCDTSETLYLQEDRVEMNYDCDICQESIVSHYDCLEHCKGHGVNNNYPCLVCGLSLSTEQELVSHFAVHKNKTTTSRRVPGKPVLECGACSRKFNTKKDFILHQCSKPILNVLQAGDEVDLSCQICDKTFKTFERAAKHHSCHSDGNKLQCGVCQKEYETEEMLNYHVETEHEQTESPSCQTCFYKFYSKQLLEKHEKTHSQTTYQCNFCSKTSVDFTLMSGHVATHMSPLTQKNDYHCYKCDVTFSKKGQYLFHMENNHENELLVKRMPSLIQYQCSICTVRCTTSQDTLIHRTTHFKSIDDNLPHVCEYCGEPFPSPNSLARHRRIIHPSERPYVCTVCETKTRTLYEARVHRKSHTGYVTPQKRQPKIYQCESCPSLFSDKSSFLSHKKSHKQTKGFQCEFCKKVFPERHRLIVHRRQHTGEKPYSCGVCGKRFAQTSAMYTHSLLHTGETPHGCDLCGRRFRIKSDRDNHRRTHTGEKPYHCQYCGKSFRTGQVYYQHRMIHTGERRFPCDVCGRAFKRSHTLVCHKRIHTGEKPNICNVCGKGFRQRTDMRKHKINLHGVAA